MSYRFEAGRIYRMPTHFGPAPGPRQLPDGVAADSKHNPRRLTVAASFLTDAALLERHLPEGFTVAGEPVVTVEFHYLTGIDAHRDFKLDFRSGTCPIARDPGQPRSTTASSRRGSS